MHPVDAQVGAGIFGGCDDTSAQVSAGRRRRDRLRAMDTLDGREASHESRAFHSLPQAISSDVGVRQLKPSHARISEARPLRAQYDVRSLCLIAMSSSVSMLLQSPLAMASMPLPHRSTT